MAPALGTLPRRLNPFGTVTGTPNEIACLTSQRPVLRCKDCPLLLHRPMAKAALAAATRGCAGYARAAAAHKLDQTRQGPPGTRSITRPALHPPGRRKEGPNCENGRKIVKGSRARTECRAAGSQPIQASGEVHSGAPAATSHCCCEQSLDGPERLPMEHWQRQCFQHTMALGGEVWRALLPHRGPLLLLLLHGAAMLLQALLRAAAALTAAGLTPC